MLAFLISLVLVGIFGYAALRNRKTSRVWFIIYAFVAVVFLLAAAWFLNDIFVHGVTTISHG